MQAEELRSNSGGGVPATDGGVSDKEEEAYRRSWAANITRYESQGPTAAGFSHRALMRFKPMRFWNSASPALSERPTSRFGVPSKEPSSRAPANLGIRVRRRGFLPRSRRRIFSMTSPECEELYVWEALMKAGFLLCRACVCAGAAHTPSPAAMSSVRPGGCFSHSIGVSMAVA